jgi:hypothetical protein
MYSQELKIPKKLKQVTLWIHPEGRVLGSLFLSLQNRNYTGEEEPLEVLNTPEPFLVMKREDPEELRFYNKASIVCMEYQGERPQAMADVQALRCRLSLMDGSIIDGSVRRALHPDNARLYDYLNMGDERFAELYQDNGVVSAVNKSYIVYVTPLHERRDSTAAQTANEPEVIIALQ